MLTVLPKFAEVIRITKNKQENKHDSPTCCLHNNHYAAACTSRDDLMCVTMYL